MQWCVEPKPAKRIYKCLKQINEYDMYYKNYAADE